MEVITLIHKYIEILTVPSIEEIDQILLKNPIQIPSEEAIIQSWQRMKFKLNILKILNEESQCQKEFHLT
jgi:hypothetical protein